MKRCVKLGDKLVGEGCPCFVVAEAGINHNGDLKVAQKLVKAAAASGADAVKFQSFNADKLIHKSLDGYRFFREMELSMQEEEVLRDVAEGEGIMFFSTPFDEERVDFLDSLNVPVFKVSSGDLTYIHLIQHIASKKKPLIVSTGMADMAEIEFTLAAIDACMMGCSESVILLYCVSLYPPSPCDVKLANMIKIKETFGSLVGYSDHLVYPYVSIAAVSLGACLVERHFTLDRNMVGPDHAISSDPEEMSSFIRAVREIECTLGGVYITQNVADVCENDAPSDIKMRPLARRGMYARFDIKAGSMINLCDVDFLRPQKDGIDPSFFYSNRNKVVAKVDIKAGELIKDVMIDNVDSG